MAARVPSAPLSPEELRSLCAEAEVQQRLLPLHFVVETEGSILRAAAYVVKRRSGGFMVALPLDDAVRNFLLTFTVESEPIFVVHQCEV